MARFRKLPRYLQGSGSPEPAQPRFLRLQPSRDRRRRLPLCRARPPPTIFSTLRRLSIQCARSRSPKRPLAPELPQSQSRCPPCFPKQTPSCLPVLDPCELGCRATPLRFMRQNSPTQFNLHAADELVCLRRLAPCQLTWQNSLTTSAAPPLQFHLFRVVRESPLAISSKG